MASLKKLFQPSSPRSGGEIQGINSQQYFSNPAISEPRTPASPYAYPPQSQSKQDVNRHYEGIERQFEQLHETFYSRTLASLRQFRYHGSSEQAEQKNRYIDVVDALFSTHRYQMSTRSMSPITPYNEDVADRNIIAQHFPQVNNEYSRLVSTLYQEDVADRNIARARTNPIYKGPRSSRLSVRSDDQEARSSSLRSKSHGRSREPRISYPPANSAKAQGGGRTVSRAAPGRKNDMLRPQASAPDLSITEVKTPDLASFPRPPTSSGVETSGNVRKETPKEGSEKIWKEALKEAARVPSGEEDAAANDSPVSSESSAPDAATSEVSRLSDAKSTSSSSRTSGKKNVRDLSINTDITAFKKPSIRIEHCAIQPPTPQGAPAISQNASIAEIVHGSLLTVSTNSSKSQPSPALDVDEIMKILKQAYNSSTYKPSPLYPTFETLQEIIVREINSHDAFRSVRVSPTDSQFTPPSSDNSFDEHILLPPPGPSRLKPLPPDRENPLSKLIRRRSNIGPRSKSPSLHNSSPPYTSSPPMDSSSSHDDQSIEPERHPSPPKKPLVQGPGPVIPRRRRHTYGQPSTPSFPNKQPEQGPQFRPRAPTHSASSTSISSSSSFSLFPISRSLPQPRYKSHFVRKSDPVPPSPHFTEFLPTDATTPPIYPSYVRP